jgi:phospho-N-acetylmuramoyl-pentapeptide-transferase
MGGWLFVVTSVVAIGLLVPDRRVSVPICLALIAHACFGALDDYANIRDRQGIGFEVKAQLLWQFLIAVAVGWVLYDWAGPRAIDLPFGLAGVPLGVWTVPFAVLVIVATSSGANLIDGLDGLAAGTIGIAFVAYVVIALKAGDRALATACAAIVGSLFAFLWFNVNPARVFMGGTGSLALGAALAVVALLTNTVLVLPIVAAPLVLVLLSVILQVGYFKLSGGRRIFLRAPIHHHFELMGVPEVTIVSRFWLVAAAFAAPGLACLSI